MAPHLRSTKHVQDWVEKYIRETKDAVLEISQGGNSLDEKKIEKAIAGLKTIISSTFHFDERIPKKVQNDRAFDRWQLYEFIPQEEREKALDMLIELTKKYPKKTYEMLQYSDHLQPLDVNKEIQEYRNVIGDEKVDLFLSIVDKLKKSKKRIILLNSTFYEGGVAEVLKAGMPILYHLGVNIQWHMIWSPSNAFFSTTKKIHNIIQGVSDTNPDWNIFEKVSKKNVELYKRLKQPMTNEEKIENIHFFFDDPQLAGMHMDKRDIAVLHVDTGGVDQENKQSVEVWNRLRKNWEKARYFLHQEGHSGGKYRLRNEGIIHPGTNVLSKKNIPRKSAEEAYQNIQKQIILDDNHRKPMIESDHTKFIFVGRADPAKGQKRGLLAFSNYLARDTTATLFFFIQFASDDPEGFSQYLALKLLVEEREKKRKSLEEKLKKALKNMGRKDIDEMLEILDNCFKKIQQSLPEGISSIRERVQIFINLTDVIGDFAKISTAHLILSTREGYNMVISELAKQKLPVIANDLTPFRDRIDSGKKGGWLISNQKVIPMQEKEFLQGFLEDDQSVKEYLNDIADTMEKIMRNPEESKKVVEELDEWINHNGNFLCHIIERFQLILESNNLHSPQTECVHTKKFSMEDSNDKISISSI